MSAWCPQCGGLVATDPVPPWCPHCGVTIKEPLYELDEARKLATPTPDPPPRAKQPPASQNLLAVLAVAVMVGMIAVFVGNRLMKGPTVDQRVFDGAGFSVQVPTDGWKIDEQAVKGPKDLPLQATRGVMRDASFTVRIEEGAMTLEKQAAAVIADWQRELPDCEVLPTQPTMLASEHALIIRAVGTPRSRDVGDRPYREAIVVRHAGVGYRLTFAAIEKRMQRLRPQIDELFAGFRFVPAEKKD